MMIFGLSDEGTTTFIISFFGTLTTLATTGGAIWLRRIDANIAEAKLAAEELRQEVATAKQEVVATKLAVEETKTNVAETKVKTAELARSIDGMKEALVKAAKKEGRDEATADIKLGAELISSHIAGKAPNGDPVKVTITNGEPDIKPQPVEVVNPDPVPVVVHLKDEQGNKIAELASEKPTTKEGA